MGINNTNDNPNYDSPYMPPGYSETLTDDASTQHVLPNGQVVPNQDFRSTAEGGNEPAQRGSNADVSSSILGDPKLGAPNYNLASTADLGAMAQSLISAFAPTSQRASTNMQEDIEEAVSFFAKPLSTTSASTSSTTNATTTASGTSALSDEDIESLQGLISSDKNTILAQLKKLGKVAEPLSQELSDALDAIASKMAKGEIEGLDATDAATILSALQASYPKSSAAITELLTTLSTAMGAINTSLATDMTSTNAAVVERALVAQVNTSGLTPDERTADLDYLRLMSRALAFMSETRARLSSMEAVFASKEGKAKMENQDTMTKIALEGYQKSLENIQKAIEGRVQQAEMEKKAALWKWLGPLITATVAVIALALTVASLGAAGAPMTMIVGIVAASVSVTTLGILDQTMGVLDKLCDALHIPKDKGMREAFKAGYMLLICALTMGAGCAAAAASTMTRVAFMAIVSVVLDSIVSSNLLTIGFVAALEKSNLSKEAVDIIAMCLTIATVLIVSLSAWRYAVKKLPEKMAVQAGAEAVKDATEAAAKSGGKNAAVEVAEEGIELQPLGRKPSGSIVADELEEVADEAVEAGAQKGARAAGAGSGAGAVAGVSEDVATNVAAESQRTLGQRILATFIREAKREANLHALLILMQMTGSGFKVDYNLSQAKYHLAMKDIKTQQGDLENELAELTAMLDFMQSQIPGFDGDMTKCTQDIKGLNELVENFTSLFSQFISSHSSITNEATSRG